MSNVPPADADQRSGRRTDRLQGRKGDIVNTGKKNMDIACCVLGMVQTNVYIAVNRETQELFIVDPADRADVIIRKIKETGACPAGILLTHGHFDHIMAVDDLKNAYHIPVYAMKDEQDLLASPMANMTIYRKNSVAIVPDMMMNDLDTFRVAGFDIQVLHTPGHTPGSCCYYIKDEGVLFSGDTLFRCSCGRTDFPGGSMQNMQKSLHRLLSSLPEDTAVYPGHESFTTIGYEVRNNPFV